MFKKYVPWNHFSAAYIWWAQENPSQISLKQEKTLLPSALTIKNFVGVCLFTEQGGIDRVTNDQVCLQNRSDELQVMNTRARRQYVNQILPPLTRNIESQSKITHWHCSENEGLFNTNVQRNRISVCWSLRLKYNWLWKLYPRTDSESQHRHQKPRTNILLHLHDKRFLFVLYLGNRETKASCSQLLFWTRPNIWHYLLTMNLNLKICSTVFWLFNENCSTLRFTF